LDRLTKDSKEFIESLNSNGVEYLVIGGHAVAFYGYPRFTGDLDIWVRADPENAARLARVFAEFGFTESESLIAIFSEEGSMVQLGLPPNRIDVLSRISGIDFAEAWPRRVDGRFDGLSVTLIGAEDLLRNKRASGRPKDLADLDEISKVLEREANP
jgi:predicted nucleotidyltransferase